MSYYNELIGKKYIAVRYQVEGFHCWPEAPEHRAYLRDRHRHLFYVEVTLEVFENDREVEYHDLLSQVQTWFPGGEQGTRSCEVMAMELAKDVHLAYQGREVTVSVFEDNEAGSIFRYDPKTPNQ